MRTIRAKEYKAEILAKVAPRGFKVHAFADDLHMVKTPAPGRSSVRVLTRDGGWVEFDIPSKVVRTWGGVGRAQLLAGALAKSIGCDPERLEIAGTVARPKGAPRVANCTDKSVELLVRWWIERGYTATSAPAGCWVSAGSTRIRDTGEQLEFHGVLSDAAIAAMMVKARDAWDGGLRLEGDWSQAEKDKIWMAAKRQGIELENCSPSSFAERTWQLESENVDWRNRTISAIRSKIVEAQELVNAAQGDKSALRVLPRPLQAFLASYLDDEQRVSLASRALADIIPELDRFRDLGIAELQKIEAEGRTFNVPKPDERGGRRENILSLR
ncbi:LPD7 domain-containing protein [Rhodopseudomonas palustris]|uniref:LPD7 domain-containing protein n=1 Tax=Rhodopseudomonas palustris TaxID=1076 RepID=UPI001F3A0220|nr:LPD7 domain-containing protein [Rhodopseudomonas palustris]